MRVAGIADLKRIMSMVLNETVDVAHGDSESELEDDVIEKKSASYVLDGMRLCEILYELS